MKKNLLLSLDGKWNLSYMPNSQYKKLEAIPGSERELRGMKKISADVPGVFEQDLYKAGVTGDPYFGMNILDVQDLECMHLFYYRDFEFEEVPDEGIFLCFEGIDTFAEIYLNGEFLGQTDNMLIPHELEVPADILKKGKNEIFVHITPAPIVTRDYPTPANSNSLEYISDLLYARKAPSMGGWDIMPRVLGGGMWRSVYLEKKKENRIDDVFVYTCSANEGGNSHIIARYTLAIADDLLKDYRVVVRGSCGDSSFEGSGRPIGVSGRISVNVPNTKLWWPKNYGDPNLYDVTAYLYKGDELKDTFTLKTGIRTVELDRTSITNKNGDGEFCFKINGKKIFYLGSNWVPLDAFHSNDLERLPKAMELLMEVGCNGVRCWGGNVYESDEFFDFCDSHGIMIWQDFAMACGVFPQDQVFYDMISEEVAAVVKRLRNHCSIILWAGDNECDYSYMGGNGITRDPNKNVITRRIIPELLDAHDFTRPYIPSSPYIDEEGFKTGGGDGFGVLSEDHLWGPRDYYKGKYYKNTVCHFASETGYHGCPSPSSLAKFISKDSLWPWYDEKILKERGEYIEKVEWRVHDASPETRDDAPFAYRIRLMVSQIRTLFGYVPENLRDFAIASQISQGEAFKFFIERFRITKWRRTGIIWWNLIDGWPQISDAVVDYYYSKKMAFYYIKRSQQPVCFMFDEPVEIGGKQKINLYGVSDLQRGVKATYRVFRLGNVGKDEESEMKKTLVLEGNCELADNSSRLVASIDFEPHAFYKIEWTYEDENGEVTGANSYLAGDPFISLERYVKALDMAGFNDFTE